MILGTMPSVASLEQSFYYAHPRNAFWPIMQILLNKTLVTDQEKALALKERGIFLWDVLQGCERKGSLDSAIKHPQANNFEAVFKHYPNLNVVAFNGQAAEKLFKQQVLKKQTLPDDLTYLCLPSTSPANARLSLQDKVLLWQEKLNNLL
ncbi:MAG: DNA-deoxyinosine glycosylase [Thiotrichales bacterium]|nr:DNA-deoxyinosine glycosylase [Thiotrichales bacterium]